MSGRVERNETSRTYHCTDHGLCVITIGQWTGRRMAECPICGMYLVITDEDAEASK